MLKAFGNTLVLLLLGSTLALLFISHCFWPAGDAGTFWPNFLLNATAELLGLAATTVLGLLIAIRLGQSRLHGIAEALAQLVRELQEGKTITPAAARATMIFSAKLIFEDTLMEQEDGNVASVVPEREHQNCPVCTLTYSSIEPASNSLRRRCKNCRLPGGSWDLVKIKQ